MPVTPDASPEPPQRPPLRVSRRLAFVLTAAGALAGAALAWYFRPVRPPPAAPAASSAAAPLRHEFEPAEVVFDAGFGKGWADWGWGPHELVENGPLKVRFSNFGGVMFHHAELPSLYGALVFRFRAPESFGSFLSVSLRYKQLGEAEFPSVAIEPRHVLELADGWKQALVPWHALNPLRSPFDRVVIRASTVVAEDWVEIDKVVLAKPLAERLAAAPAPVRPVRISVDCRGKRRRIDPLIYGISQGPLESGKTAHRIGGNPMTRHNWELGVWNAGSDWYFENVKGETGLYDWLKGAATDQHQTALVVPMIGWVAKDGTSVGFPVSKFGKQRAHDPNRPEAGDGHRPDGTPIPPGPPTETSVPAPPEKIRRWIEDLRKKDAEVGGRHVDMYILDNEPDLWHVTHRDVHPEPVGYDELLDRTIRYGTAIRQADPEAVIAGPASWGWTGYFYSAKDTASGFLPNADRLTHGGIPLIPWYLQRLAAYEQETKIRVLDVLDVHFYPQAPGVYENGKGRTDPETAALRIRSTRALWDPDYSDESWIKERVRLIPRLKEWVEKNYPGRRVALGEWSFGAEDHISGGLAIAEALGRFGQHGLDAAFYWGGVDVGTPAFWAFRAYRNFDGAGARFLDWSVPTRSPREVSFFASIDDGGRRLVAVVLNLDPGVAAEAQIDLSSCGKLVSKRVFGYAEGSSEITPVKVEGAEPRELFAPYSINVLDYALEPSQR